MNFACVAKPAMEPPRMRQVERERERRRRGQREQRERTLAEQGFRVAVEAVRHASVAL